jgi:hypothetical protein
MSDQPRMLRLAELWERTSAKGARYFSGFMGDVQLLLFDGGEKEHPTRPGERVHVWRLMAQERDPNRRPQARREQPTRGPATDQAVREQADQAAPEILGSKAERDRAVQQWSERFDARGPDDEVPW